MWFPSGLNATSLTTPRCPPSTTRSLPSSRWTTMRGTPPAIAMRPPVGSKEAAKTGCVLEKTTSDRPLSTSQTRTVPAPADDALSVGGELREARVLVATPRPDGSTRGVPDPHRAVEAAADHPPAVRAEARSGDRRLDGCRGGGSPRPERPVLAAADDRVGPGHERSCENRAPVAFQLRERWTSAGVPHAHHAVLSGRDEPPRIAAEAHRVRLLLIGGDAQRTSAAACVPDADDPVRRGRRDLPPVWAEVGAGDSIGMTEHGRRAAREIPNPCGVIDAGADGRPTVRTEVRRPGRPRVPAQHGGGSVATDRDDTHGAIDDRNDETSAVAAELHAGRVVRCQIRQDAPLFGSHVPNRDHAVVAGAGDLRAVRRQGRAERPAIVCLDRPHGTS